jgi:hypothetical protein
MSRLALGTNPSQQSECRQQKLPRMNVTILPSGSTLMKNDLEDAAGLDSPLPNLPSPTTGQPNQNIKVVLSLTSDASFQS